MEDSDGRKLTPPSLSENVLLKRFVYHIVTYVNNECLGKGNYENYVGFEKSYDIGPNSHISVDYRYIEKSPNSNFLK